MSSVSSGCRPAVGSVTPHQLCLGSPLSLKGCVDLYTANVVVGGHPFLFLTAYRNPEK